MDHPVKQNQNTQAPQSGHFEGSSIQRTAAPPALDFSGESGGMFDGTSMQLSSDAAPQQHRSAHAGNPIQARLLIAGQKAPTALPSGDRLQYVYDTLAPAVLPTLMQAISDNKAFLTEQLKEVHQEQEIDVLAKFEDHLSGSVGALALANILWAMVDSATEYGEINLGNKHHVLKFLKDAKAYLGDSWWSQWAQDSQGKEEDFQKWEEWIKVKQSSPDPARTYKTILLGTGASIAYYVNANGGGLDSEETLIIGKQQPWDPNTAESRGIDFINHPMHMVSPDRQETQLPTQSNGSDETFQGNASTLTQQITNTFDRFGIQTVNATITNVSRGEEGMYTITTDGNTYYAQNVVSGLGIGPHNMPTNKAEYAEQITSEQDNQYATERIMDLDTFQRNLTQGAIPPSAVIGVSGPNAGVDAVYTATERGHTVKWIVAGGPAIAPGMGNKIGDKGKVTMYFDYMAGWTVTGDNPNQKLVMQINGKNWRGKKAEATQKWSDAGWTLSDDATAQVDYMVIAQGPNTQAVFDLFDKSITTDLELKGDKGGRFGAKDGSGVWQGDISDSLRSAPYNIYWEAIYNRVEQVLGSEGVMKWEETRNHLKTEALRILGIADFERITLPSGLAVGLGSEDGSFQVIGGSAIRFLNLIDGKNRALSQGRTVNDQEKLSEKLNSGKESAKMSGLIESFSSPTILGNDQLTPTRGQVEAMSNYMPGYIGTDEANFVTDDRMMIEQHIMLAYPDVPFQVARYVTDMIIKNRHEQGVRPGTDGGARSFVDAWKQKLASLNTLFSAGSIQGFAAGI